MIVKVEALRYEWASETVDWHMLFAFTLPNDITFTFDVEEPDILELRDWQNMCDGKPNIYGFYQGNGEGYIQVTEDARMVFTAMPSGSGGDVIGRFSVPHALVKEPLSKAIAEAQAQKFWST